MSVPQNVPYSTWLEINLSAVEENTRQIIRSTGVNLMTVVKGNAYGHGAVEVGKATLAAGASWLAVARVIEAITLRQAGIKAPILVLGMPPSMEVDQAIAEDITLPLAGFEALEIFSNRARAMGKTLKVHLKVDTGLGRLGVMPEEILPLARKAQEAGGIEINGLFSHFAFADADQHPMMATQTGRFKQALDSLNENGIYPAWVHHSNSGATLAYPDARFNTVRAAQAVLGLNPFVYRSRPEVIRPALTAWKARLVSCKTLPKGWGVGYGSTYVVSEEKELIGVAGAGFGDGIRRVKDIQVLIGGQKVPVLGSTCMDQIMLRLPRPYPLDTEIVLVGSQGQESIGIEELAACFGTVHVDVTTLITSRVPRVYYRD